MCQIHKQGIWTKLYFHFCRLNLVSYNPSINKSHSISFSPIPITFKTRPWLTSEGEWVRRREKCQNIVVQDASPEEYSSSLSFSDHAFPKKVDLCLYFELLESILRVIILNNKFFDSFIKPSCLKNVWIALLDLWVHGKYSMNNISIFTRTCFH